MRLERWRTLLMLKNEVVRAAVFYIYRLREAECCSFWYCKNEAVVGGVLKNCVCSFVSVLFFFFFNFFYETLALTGDVEEGRDQGRCAPFFLILVLFLSYFFLFFFVTFIFFYYFTVLLLLFSSPLFPSFFPLQFFL